MKKKKDKNVRLVCPDHGSTYTGPIYLGDIVKARLLDERIWVQVTAISGDTIDGILCNNAVTFNGPIGTLMRGIPRSEILEKEGCQGGLH